jgi:hypothetical protein
MAERGIDSGHPWPSPCGRLLRRRLPGLSCPVIEPLCFALGSLSDQSLRQIQKRPRLWPTRGIDSGHPWPSPCGRLLRRRLPGLSCPVIEPLVLRTGSFFRPISSSDTKKAPPLAEPFLYMAEREGLEPSKGCLNPYSLSRGAPSATRPPLLNPFFYTPGSSQQKPGCGSIPVH